MTEPRQLTVDGREVPAFGADPTRRDAPLTAAQRAILTFVRAEGAITPTDAGLIVHAARKDPCKAAELAPRRGCCPWCAADGALALKRLERRGILTRTVVGLWEPVNAPA